MNGKELQHILDNFWKAEPVLTTDGSNILPTIYIRFKKRPLRKYKIRFVSAERHGFARHYNILYVKSF